MSANRNEEPKKTSWYLEDAQDIARNNPYTFYKPSGQVIQLLKAGNQVKLIFSFESNNPDDPAAERMWVEITQINKDGSFTGFLDNDPVHIQGLKHEDIITFKTHHIIETDLDDPVPSIVDKYIKRCFVTNNILYDGEKAGYLYREKPDYPEDSGWRITTGAETDEYMDDPENSAFVSLGAVLGVDDSFIDLLEREGDVHFARDENGQFVELEE